MTEQQVAEVQDRARSVGEMLVRQVEKSGPREAFRHRDAEGRWVSLSWRQTQDAVFELAAGLLSLGLQPEDRVALISNTRIEWILADLAVGCAGGATTTVYPTTQDADACYILADSASRIAIIEDEEQLAKLLKHRDQLNELFAIVLMEGSSDDPSVLTLEELRAAGHGHLEQHPDAVRERIAATEPEHLATLIYTSGTTGRPKGVRLIHDCWAYEGRAVELYELLGPDDLQFLWLPLSHVFGKDMIALQLQIGFATAVDGTIERIVEGLGEVRPTFMCGAPRIFEKVRAKVMLGNSSGLKGKIAAWAFGVGFRTNDYRVAGRPLPAMLKAQYALATKLVFSKLQARMGGRIRFFVSGSAKLNAQVQQWFYAAGLLIIEGYGLTETSAVATVTLPNRPKMGSVGPALPGSSIKIAEDGEVLIKGPQVAQGYHNQPELTAESFVDGWFHTGDIGQLDDDGSLQITDRKKDLIKTSGGKYVAPQKVEGALVANCNLVSQVIVHGEGRKYIAALLALDNDSVLEWAQGNGIAGDLKQVLASQELQAYLDRDVAAANAQLERWETVKRFAVLPAELSIDKGEVTPSMKIRRTQVERSYAGLLDSLYDRED